jgi:hypothetical protein
VKKKFNAVMFQRQVREELSKRYLENREVFLKELKEKYGNLQKEKGRHTLQITTAQTQNPT